MPNVDAVLLSSCLACPASVWVEPYGTQCRCHPPALLFSVSLLTAAERGFGDEMPQHLGHSYANHWVPEMPGPDVRRTRDEQRREARLRGVKSVNLSSRI